MLFRDSVTAGVALVALILPGATAIPLRVIANDQLPPLPTGVVGQHLGGGRRRSPPGSGFSGAVDEGVDGFASFGDARQVMTTPTFKSRFIYHLPDYLVTP